MLAWINGEGCGKPHNVFLCNHDSALHISVLGAWSLALLPIIIFASVLLCYRTPWMSHMCWALKAVFRCRGDAGARVSGTFELLEYILLRLPMQDILLAQRVSKQFNQVIKDSQPLRRALFLEPALPVPGGTKPEQPVLNPLLFLRRGTVLGGMHVQWRSDLTVLRVMSNPYELPEKNEECMRLCNNEPGLCLLREDGVATTGYSKESWKKMLLTQPPSDVELGVERDEGKPRVKTLHKPTMGEVIAESRRRLELGFCMRALYPSRGRQRRAAFPPRGGQCTRTCWCRGSEIELEWAL